MGFIKPSLVPIPVDEYVALPHREKIQVQVQHWSQNGFGTPTGILVLYVVKIVGYVVGGLAVIAATTPGIGGLSDVGDWWTQPIVLQKAVLWTIAFEILGLGCGFGPLTFHFMPPYTAPFQWLRTGTIRLPPWPDRVPLTRGHLRSVVDVALYVSLVGTAVWALLTDGDVSRVPDPVADPAGLLEPGVVVPMLVVLVLVGLRDKTVFLAARPEQYAVMAALFLFPYADLIGGSKWVLVAVWWGAATSKLNHHFPYVVATMVSNAPLRPRAFRRALFRDAPNDMRPSRFAFYLAHIGTVIEYGVPLLMIIGGGNTLTKVGVVVMIVFHLHILSALPLGVPLEWNVFFIGMVPFLFWHHGDVSMFDISPRAAVFLALALVSMPILGNLRPDLVSFLPAMQYYAGNWGTSVWLMTPEGEAKFHAGLKKISPSIPEQLAVLYDEDTIHLLGGKVWAFRSMHAHGRALNTLVERAVDDIEDYGRHEGEIIAGLALGWNFGEGHLHHEQLVEACHAQCGFEPGELRVVYLESQPILESWQEYRLVDAATGEFERGRVEVRDMLDHQPWLGDGVDVPVTVLSGAEQTV